MAYIPERSDVVWISLNPQAGHERAGRRPAVVVSPRSYNAKVGLGLSDAQDCADGDGSGDTMGRV